MILITGATGYLGSMFLKRLLENNFEDLVLIVRSADRYSNLKNLLDIKKDLMIVEIDITWPLEKIFSAAKKLVGLDIEDIVHFASIVGVRECNADPYQCVKTNVVGTKNVLELALYLNIEKVTYISSAAVYGNPKYLPIDENHPTDPISLYGITKLLGEDYCKFYNKIHGLKIAIFRIFNVYGPSIVKAQRLDVITRFVLSALKNESITIFGGQQKRDFIFIDDVIDAIYLGLNRRIEGTYNLGTGNPISILELADKIIKIANSSSQIIVKPHEKHQITDSYANINLIQKTLQWKPKIDIDRGLELTIKHIKKELQNK